MSKLGLITIYGLNQKLFEEHCPDLSEHFKADYKNISLKPPIHGTYSSTMASLFTGCNPGKTNIFGEKYINSNYLSEQPFLSSLEKKPLWWSLSIKSLNSITFGIPFSYPVQAVRGNFISEYIEEKKSVFALSPDNRQDMLIKNLTDFYRVLEDTDIENITIPQFKNLIETYFQNIKIFILENIQYADYIILNIDVLRKLEKKLDTNNLNQKVISNYFNLIIDTYKALDYHLPKIISSIEKHITNIMVVSPLPVSTVKKIISINKILENNNFLIFEDIKKSKAFSLSKLGAVYLNYVDRFKKGVINKPQYLPLRNKIMEILNSKLQFESISEFTMKESVFYDEYLLYSPDIVPIVNNLDYINHYDTQKHNLLMNNNFPNNNPYEGILYIKSEIIDNTQEIDKIFLVDIYPLIFYIFNKRIPRDIEGTLTKKIIKDDYLKQHIPLYEVQDPNKIKFNKGQKKYTPVEINLVQARIKKLGYGK